MELPHRHPIALIDEHTILSDEEIEAYETYKYDMNEQKPGFPIMEIDDFLRMELGSARAGVQAGGLPGILGV